MTERCYVCGRVRITHAPEHDGATGYFEWREAKMLKPAIVCPITGYVLAAPVYKGGTDPAVLCPSCEERKDWGKRPKEKA